MMGCNCGGGAQRQWVPASQAQQQGQSAELSPNERIQAQQERVTRVWPAEWTGRRPETVAK